MQMRVIKRLRRVRANQRGISLIEVLAAMIILTLGLLTLLPMATLSIDANVQARDTDRVIQQIQNRIEDLRNAKVITSGSVMDTTSGMYTSWWTETVDQDLQKVIVEVTWESEQGVTRKQRGVTYMYKE